MTIELKDISVVDDYGGIALGLDTVELNKAGFDTADILSVSWGDRRLLMPMVPNWRNIGHGDYCLLAWPFPGRQASLLHFGGNLAAEYGFDDAEAYPITLTIEVEEKGGYLEEFANRNLPRSNDRRDYPHLSDEQYANFREIHTTGFAPGILFRGSSPISDFLERNEYSDRALKNHGIRTCFNFGSSRENTEMFPYFAQSYYSTICVHYYPVNTDFFSKATSDGIAALLRDMLTAETPMFIHCIEGQDRTGFLAGILESLMGASFEEVRDDYITTFFNYYGVRPGDKSYPGIEMNIISQMRRAFGTEDPEHIDLGEAARGYLLSIGLSEDEIAAVRYKLSHRP